MICCVGREGERRCEWMAGQVARRVGGWRSATYEEVVLGVLKHEVNTLLLQHDLPQSRDVLMRDFSIDLPQPPRDHVSSFFPLLLTESPSQPARALPLPSQAHHDLPARALTDAGVGNGLALLVGLELFDRHQLALVLCAVIAREFEPLARRGRGGGPHQARRGGVRWARAPDPRLVDAPVRA